MNHAHILHSAFRAPRSAFGTLRTFSLQAFRLSAFFSILCPLSSALGQTCTEMDIDPATASPVRLTLNWRVETPRGKGGFSVFDATAKQPVALQEGRVLRSGNGRATTFETNAPGITLRAEFLPQGDYILVKGEIVNTRGDERGFIVEYRIPPLGEAGECLFSNSLVKPLPLKSLKEVENNVFPLAALAGKHSGVALAIPPAEPRIFGTAGSADGLALRFYLGTSPMPKRFPNRASFVFIIYAVDAKWGFRSALSNYYKFFPEYYTQLMQAMKQEGMCMFQMTDRIPSNIDQYGFNLFEPQWPEKVRRAALERDDRHNITTFPYMIVGQREIKFLPSLPNNLDEIMAIFDKWTVAALDGHELTKENVASDGDINLKQEVISSACATSAGHPVIVLRNTKWGADSITFKINPNPDLFADVPGVKTTGGLALQIAARWIKDYPEYDGMFIDSLGANWPAVLNYRKDHFIYARYPLTFDPDGRVALHNQLSHYEYIETLRALMRNSGRLRLLYGNGVYAYKSRFRAGGDAIERQRVNTTFNEFHATAAPAEHYRAGTRLGRFFKSALLDVATSEFGVKATVEHCMDVRAFMGKKPYAFLNYHWEDAALVDEFVNKCLAFGIYPSTSTNFFTDVEYETNPKGYLRDKPLLDWAIPHARQLARAGWEPVRDADLRADKSISCERFGRGDVIYFTLYNDSTTPQPCELAVDLKALGFTPEEAAITEIGRATPVTPKSGLISLTLQPKKTYIIKVAKK